MVQATLSRGGGMLPGIPAHSIGSAWLLKRLAPWQRQVLAGGSLNRLALRTGATGVFGTDLSLFPPKLPGLRQTLMMYDLIPLLDPDRYVNKYVRGNRWLWRDRLPRRWREADQVIAITREVARTGKELLGIPEKSFQVVYPGVDHLEDVASSSSGMQAPFLLYVGAIEERKNIERLVSAFAQVAHPRLRMVFAGPMAPFRKEMVRKWAESAGVADRIELPGRVDDATLQALYRECLAFVFPSLLEGFGLPPLEAMRAAAPVIASRSSCLPEVLGDDALWVDGTSVESIASGIRTLLEDPDLRRRLAAFGPARASLYKWSDAGHRLAELLVGSSARA